MKVGEKIRKIRTLKGLSQDFVAEKLNISQVAYSDIENNKTKLSLERLEEISTIFKIPLNDIISFDEKTFLITHSTIPQKDFLIQERLLMTTLRMNVKLILIR